MAETVTSEPAPARASSERPPHRGRFLVVYVLLGLLLGAAVAVVLVLTTGGSSTEATPAESGIVWSDWQPSGTANERATQIAAFVSRRYRLPSGRQLVGVRAGPPRVQDVPVSTIALRTPGAGGGSDGDIALISAENSIVYILCGLGERCSIPEGKPSTGRGRLVRREALELALYSFTYMDELDSVLAFLPPPAGDPPTSALFYVRNDLAEELAQPLLATLSEPVPSLPNAIGTTEAVTIDRLTAPHEFEYQFQQLQDGSVVVVLAPPDADDG